ncbi:MAG: pyridoxine 5'-phosphate synthase [Thermoanaerobaculia bacterium]|nr:pyridoxine 5'-phosphate synthase [Thermoanaerobaculia bacterium]
MKPLHLSVNVDHIATLRQARGAPYPDPVEAAHVAETTGARGITVHLRGDRRHIQDSDVRRLRSTVRGKLNLEIAASDEMLGIALEVRPDQVTLVPERPDEVTTEGGLDVVRHPGPIRSAVRRLASADIAVSLFLDPDAEQLAALTTLDTEVIGFELNTDAYTRAVIRGDHGGDHPENDPGSIERELDKIREVAEQGAGQGLQVFAGHGLTTGNVGPVASLPQIEELNIGHWLVSRGAIVGLAQSVREMLDAMASARSE